MKNTKMTVSSATGRIVNMAKEIIASGREVQASVQSAFGCGFEGAVDENIVFGIAEKYFEAGVNKVSLADTAGHANPGQVARMFGKLLEMNPGAELACHFHNTYGLGLANCYAAMQSGATFFETAFGGLGGCPFTKVAAGNVCTEDYVHYLQRSGMRQDIDLGAIIEIAKDAAIVFEKDLPGYVLQAGPIIK
jgi:hydroxymethylglutaryl-CoA lyase